MLNLPMSRQCDERIIPAVLDPWCTDTPFDCYDINVRGVHADRALLVTYHQYLCHSRLSWTRLML